MHGPRVPHEVFARAGPSGEEILRVLVGFEPITRSAGDHDVARELDERLAGLHTALFVETNPIPSKWALGRLGLIGAGIRLPLVRLSDAYHAEVLAAMRRAGVIE